MSLVNEYIEKRLSAKDLEKELLTLIGKYNKLRKTFLFVYAAAIGKQIPAVALEQNDYYFIRDLLTEAKTDDQLDFYIETPGGSGEAAEEIVRCLRPRFKKVCFVVSGEAKSAGTIIVLSGDEILMTETGSLGPIDAQMRIGRSIVSAHDYMEWVNEKRNEATSKKYINPFDATIVAQISPGELEGVHHSLKFAEDLVVEWLTKYKFQNWKITETNSKQVTQEMREQRAKEIASELTNHSKWRSHGRSLKLENLESIGLKITKVDEDEELKDLVYRIQMVCKFLFETTSIIKIFATENTKIFRHAAQGMPPVPQQSMPDTVEFDIGCPKCGVIHRLYAKLKKDSSIDDNCSKKGLKKLPSDSKLKCGCGFVMDLSGLRNQVETNTKKKIID